MCAVVHLLHGSQIIDEIDGGHFTVNAAENQVDLIGLTTQEVGELDQKATTALTEFRNECAVASMSVSRSLRNLYRLKLATR